MEIVLFGMAHYHLTKQILLSIPTIAAAGTLDFVTVHQPLPCTIVNTKGLLQ
jgi:hypothetical protein